jgi:murein DD-endopeptidase MepM/ murein hydrolase activator NlpD
MALKRKWLIRVLLIGLTAVLFFSFTTSSPCGTYPDWSASPYVLPYPVGESYTVSQGNCVTWGGHRGSYRFSYDFAMPIGALVTASRAGVVVEIRTEFVDGDIAIGHENLVKIEHDDGTIAAYSHLSSILVADGEEVRGGDPLGRSGNTGQTGGFPHLHFQVSPCWEPTACTTLPVTFRNTLPNPNGLLQNETYPAR